MSDLGECCVCGNLVRLRPGWLEPRAVVTHDHPVPCRSVCAGSGLPARVAGADPRPVSEQTRIDTGHGLSVYADPMQREREHGPRKQGPPDLGTLGLRDEINGHAEDRKGLNEGHHASSVAGIIHCGKCGKIPSPLFRAAKWDERHLCMRCDRTVARRAR